MSKLFFNQKLFHFFCQKVPPFGNVYYKYGILYTLYIWVTLWIFYLIYGIHCRKSENGKTWRNEVDTKTVKIANSRDSFLNIEKEFYHTVEDFFCINFQGE